METAYGSAGDRAIPKFFVDPDQTNGLGFIRAAKMAGPFKMELCCESVGPLEISRRAAPTATSRALEDWRTMRKVRYSGVGVACTVTD